MAVAPERRQGRPRSPEADEAILHATLQLLSEQGFDGMSVDAVAERARVGKATIYRRWSSKQELVAAALSSINATVELPDTGDTRQDLIALVRAFYRVSAASVIGPTMSRVLVAAAHNPELMQILRETVMAKRRAMGREVIERGIARGEVRADIDPDVVIDMVVGAILQHVIVDCAEIFSLLPFLESLLDVIWQGIASPADPIGEPLAAPSAE